MLMLYDVWHIFPILVEWKAVSIDAEKSMVKMDVMLALPVGKDDILDDHLYEALVSP